MKQFIQLLLLLLLLLLLFGIFVFALFFFRFTLTVERRTLFQSRGGIPIFKHCRSIFSLSLSPLIYLINGKIICPRKYIFLKSLKICTKLSMLLDYFDFLRWNPTLCRFAMKTNK